MAFSGLGDSDDIDRIERDAHMRLERFKNAHATSSFDFEQSCSNGATAASTGAEDEEARGGDDAEAKNTTALGGTRKIGESMGPWGEAILSWPNGADLDQLEEFLNMATRMIKAEARGQRSH